MLGGYFRREIISEGSISGKNNFRGVPALGGAYYRPFSAEFTTPILNNFKLPCNCLSNQLATKTSAELNFR